MKKIKYLLMTVFSLLMWFVFMGNTSAQVAPSYYDNFAGYLVSDKTDWDGRLETVYNIDAVSSEKSLQENIRCLFYPNAYNLGCGTSVKWWLIWQLFRDIWLWLLILFVTIVWVKMIMSGGDWAKIKEHLMSLLYIVYGAAIFFGSTWILWSMLGVEHLQWTEALVNKIQWDSNSLWFKVVSFLKALAFFVAIIMIVIDWFKMMSTADKADKAKAAIKWVINVVVALVVIKVIDYVYYIALQPDFVWKATSLIVEVAKILWFIIWAFLVLMVFYAGFLFITDQWKSENMKKAKNIIIWTLLVAFVIFMLLLIMYQIFAEFA